MAPFDQDFMNNLYGEQNCGKREDRFSFPNKEGLGEKVE